MTVQVPVRPVVEATQHFPETKLYNAALPSVSRPFNQGLSDESSTNLNFSIRFAEFFGNSTKSASIPIAFQQDYVKRLLEAFTKILCQLHLSLLEIREFEYVKNGLQAKQFIARAEAKQNASDILFGGSILCVEQSIIITCRDGNPRITVNLDFLHPNSTTKKIDTRACLKRARYVQLFSAAWIKFLCKFDLIPSKYPVNNKKRPRSEKAKVVSQHNITLAATRITKTKRSSPKRVRFGKTPTTCQSVSFSLEEREARMAFGAVVTYDNGEIRPLRSCKTGELIAVPIAERPLKRTKTC